MDTDDFDVFSDALTSTALVVTVQHDGRRAGCLVGFSTQCSIHPPHMLVCLSRANHTYDVAVGADHLAVHVLGEDDKDLAELFGGSTGDEVDKFDRCDWVPGPSGVPLLVGAAYRMVGRVLAKHDLGDHAGFVLEPVGAEAVQDVEALEVKEVESMQPGHPA